MDSQFKDFQALLRHDLPAAQLYNSCSDTQKRAILLQLRSIQSPEQLSAFVDHLPSAAL